MPSCPECESPISANEPFCPVCGIALGNLAPPVESKPIVVPEIQVEPTPIAVPEAKTEPTPIPAAEPEPTPEPVLESAAADEFDGTLMMSPAELAALAA